jgi:ribosomal protein S4
LYGKKIKFLVFNKNCNKIAFGKPFMSMISFFELRLNILILRMRFAYKQLEANLLIMNGLILVNGVKKNKNYLVCVNDIIIKPQTCFPKQKRFLKKKWRRYK